jgi:lipopolysaccharide biosynthesis glycosyltransferase
LEEGVWERAFSKYLIWRLVEYDTVIWLDADNLILHNIDELFFYPELSAPPDVQKGNCVILTTRVSSVLMVAQPNPEILKQFMEFLSRPPADLAMSLHNDLDALNFWFHVAPQITERLNGTYGTFPEKCNCMFEIPFAEVKVSHFLHKPWKMVNPPKNTSCRYPFFHAWHQTFTKATGLPFQDLHSLLGETDNN